MFRQLRLQLTLWYAAALVITLLTVGVLVYWLVARSLDNQINNSLHDASHLAAQVLRQDPAVTGSGSNGSEPPEGDDEGGENGQESGDYGEYATIFADSLLSSTGDVIPLVLDSDEQVVSNPRQLPIDNLPLAEALSGARSGGGHRTDTNVGGNQVRMLTTQVVGSDGQVFGYVVTLKSLEDRNQALRQLLLLLSAAGVVGLVLAVGGGVWVSQFAIRPVRRAFERQRDFVADASHELRTPLTVVRVNAESLLDRAAGPDREALQDIVDETGYMTRLVSDLLTLAQADRGQIELRHEPLDLFDVVRAAEPIGRRLAHERQLDFTSNAGHVVTHGDADRLRELLMILVDNAARYTPAGGRVTVEARHSGGKAELVVTDTGVGIEPEHLGRVFDRFYRVDKARSRAEGGLGLGLSIARAIVEAHGGTIEAESTPGRGTTVLVTLPAARASRLPTKAGTPSPDAPGTPSA